MSSNVKTKALSRPYLEVRNYRPMEEQAMNDIRISWFKDGQEIESYTRKVKDANQASDLVTLLAMYMDEILQQERTKELAATLSMMRGEHYNA
jgi:hypothetical protein